MTKPTTRNAPAAAPEIEPKPSDTIPPLPPGYWQGAVIRENGKPVGIVGDKVIKGVTPVKLLRQSKAKSKGPIISHNPTRSTLAAIKRMEAGKVVSVTTEAELQEWFRGAGLVDD